MEMVILNFKYVYHYFKFLNFFQKHKKGVQEAFEYTNKVMTASFHKWGPGFFPGAKELLIFY